MLILNENLKINRYEWEKAFAPCETKDNEAIIKFNSLDMDIKILKSASDSTINKE